MAETFKTCFITGCTTSSEHGKISLFVPRDETRRRSWFSAARKPYSQQPRWCCEDHFNLEQDAENWQWFKTMGKKLVLKRAVIPHIHLCTPLKRERTGQFTDSAKKRKRKNLAKGDTDQRRSRKQRLVFLQDTNDVDENNSRLATQINSPRAVEHCDDSTLAEPLLPTCGTSSLISEQLEPSSCTALALPSTSGINDTETMLSTTHDMSPIRRSDTSTTWTTTTSSRKYSSSLTCGELENEIGPQSFKHKDHVDIILQHSKFFLGIPKSELCLVDLLLSNLEISKTHVLLTLKKFRTNDVDFGVSTHQAGMIFRRSSPLLSKFLQQFVYWPSREDILINLPIQFRLRFSKLQSIIDCFEVEIERPSSAHAQALSYSSYKHCNTVKILISITPHGFINFLSRAYGGRISDNKLVEESKYLNMVPSYSEVLADRGFKQLESALARKNCKLIRPPTVSADVKMSKEDVKLTRRIASARIHVERAIGRIREFRFLDIHARIDNHLLNLIDHASIVVAGIVNIQGPLVKM